MTLALSEHLPLIASAPDGIQKLRGLILELAVRGKLVPQDLNDEPASELLKRVTKQRDRHNAATTRKRTRQTSISTDDNWPFSIPKGWEWSRIIYLSDVVRGVSYEKSQASENGSEGFTPLLRGHNINQNLNFDDVVFVPSLIVSEEQMVRKGDIVIAMSSGSSHLVGKAAQAESDTNCGFGAFCGVIRAYSEELHPYFGFFFQTPLYRKRVAGQGKGIGINNLQKGALLSLECPIPPLAEQHRIVAKVDELMALCDRLESEQNNSVASHTQLVETLLGTLTQSADAADFEVNWKRIAEHFDTLFTTEASIDELQKTILQLAVMGKLVPQDPLEESAITLLKLIDCEKERLSKEQGLKTNAAAQISLDEHYINLPTGWVFQRLGNLAKFIDYRGKTPNKINAGVPLITAKNIRFGFISRAPYEFISEKEYVDWMTRGLPRVGDVLFTTEAPLGNVALVDIEDKFALAQRVICFQFHEPLIAPFIRLALMAGQVIQRVSQDATGMTATGIKASRLKEIPIPIPPLAEQHRLVSKVDALMALCESLKAQLAASQKNQSTLADSLVKMALAA